MGSRTLPLEFGPQQHAVQFRLTPQLKQALLDAAARGERTSIRVSEGTGAITVGEQEYEFRTNEEASTDLLRLPLAHGDGPALEIAQIRQKLHLQRVLTDEERLRARERGAEAERERKERTMLRLEQAPKLRSGPSKATLHKSPAPPVARPSAPGRPAQGAAQKLGAGPPHRSTTPVPHGGGTRPPTPPAPRGRTPPPSSSLGQQPNQAPSRAPTPPPLPGQRAAPPTAPNGIARTSTPPPHAGKPASKGKPSALLSKLGAKGGAAAAGGPGGRGKSATPPLRGATGRERPPPAALEGARQKSVALCLLGLLAERTYKRQTLEQALGDVAQAVPGFKPPTGEALSAALKRVADYKSPGVYVMHAKHAQQAEELRAQAAAAEHARPDQAPQAPPPQPQPQQQPPRSRSSSRTVSDTASPDPEADQAPPPAPTPAAPRQQQQQQQPPLPKPAAAPAKRAAAKTSPPALQRQQQQRGTPEPGVRRLQLVEDDAIGFPAQATQALLQRDAPPAGAPSAAARAAMAPAKPSPRPAQQQGAGAPQQQQQLPLQNGQVAKARGGQAPAKPQAPARSGPAKPSAKRKHQVLLDDEDDGADDDSPPPRSAPSASPSARRGASSSAEEGGGRERPGATAAAAALAGSSPEEEEDAPGAAPPPGKKRRSASSIPGVVAPAPKVSVPSALASSNVADDSWFAPHEARAAVAYAPVCDGGAYRAYCDEYNAKFEVYQRLHQEMSAVKRYVEALKEAARTAACGAHRREYAGQAKQLFLRTQTLMQRWSRAFQVLHTELETLLRQLEGYRTAKMRAR